MSAHLTDDQRALLRKRLLQQGQIVAQRLTDLLAKKDNNFAALPPRLQTPTLNKEAQLRDYLRTLTTLTRALEQHPGGGYGVCRRCHQPIPYHELDQMPWADTCRACTAAV
jgi:RNA polymerase-binding transcription factor DksA